MPVSYDYAIARLVPRVEREEFLNVGALVSCEAEELLLARLELDEARLLALAPTVDLELARRHLAAFERIAAGGADAGPLGALPRRTRFHWLTAVRSALVQTSPVHMGWTSDATAEADRLLERMVRAEASHDC